MTNTATDISPRNTLRDVLRELAAATKAYGMATDTATQAEGFVTEAEAALAKFDKTDDAGGEHLAKSIVEWTRGGPRPTLAPPPDVAALRAGRLAATDDMAAARAALAGLTEKAAEAASAVTLLAARRDNLRVLVLCQEETTLVARVRAADAACQAARDQLEAFLGLHISVDGRAALFPAMPATVETFHTWPSVPQRPIGGGTLEPLLQPYTALVAKLAVDADAELEAAFAAPPTTDPVTVTMRERARKLLSA